MHKHRKICLSILYPFFIFIQGGQAYGKKLRLYKGEHKGTITRAEAAQLLYGLLDDKTGGYSVYFTDVDNGAWYAEAVKVLSSKGIIAGSNGMFESGQFSGKRCHKLYRCGYPIYSNY